MNKKLLLDIIECLEIKKDCLYSINTPNLGFERIKLVGKIEATQEIIDYLKILAE